MGSAAGLGGIWEISFADYCGGRLARRGGAVTTALRHGARRWRARAHIGAVGAEACATPRRQPHHCRPAAPGRGRLAPGGHDRAAPARPARGVVDGPVSLPELERQRWITGSLDHLTRKLPWGIKSRRPDHFSNARTLKCAARKARGCQLGHPGLALAQLQHVPAIRQRSRRLVRLRIRLLRKHRARQARTVRSSKAQGETNSGARWRLWAGQASRP